MGRRSPSSCSPGDGDGPGPGARAVPVQDLGQGLHRGGCDALQRGEHTFQARGPLQGLATLPRCWTLLLSCMGVGRGRWGAWAALLRCLWLLRCTCLLLLPEHAGCTPGLHPAPSTSAPPALGPDTRRTRCVHVHVLLCRRVCGHGRLHSGGVRVHASHVGCMGRVRRVCLAALTLLLVRLLHTATRTITGARAAVLATAWVLRCMRLRLHGCDLRLQLICCCFCSLSSFGCELGLKLANAKLGWRRRCRGKPVLTSALGRGQTGRGKWFVLSPVLVMHRGEL